MAATPTNAPGAKVAAVRVGAGARKAAAGAAAGKVAAAGVAVDERMAVVRMGAEPITGVEADARAGGKRAAAEPRRANGDGPKGAKAAAGAGAKAEEAEVKAEEAGVREEKAAAVGVSQDPEAEKDDLEAGQVGLPPRPPHRAETLTPAPPAC